LKFIIFFSVKNILMKEEIVLAIAVMF
jgi:hypothetical protein